MPKKKVDFEFEKQVNNKPVADPAELFGDGTISGQAIRRTKNNKEKLINQKIVQQSFSRTFLQIQKFK